MNRVVWDYDLIAALNHDGQESIDELVPDPVSKEEAERMMQEAIRYAKEKVATSRKRGVLDAPYRITAVIFSAFHNGMHVFLKATGKHD